MLMAAAQKIDFTDTAKAFSKKSTADLKQAEMMFALLNHPVLGPLGKSLLKFSVKVGLPVKPIIKATLYKQFVGGESLEDCIPMVEKLAAQNVMSILDYSEEGRESEEDMEKAFKELLRNVHFAGTHKHVTFSVFKVTAIAAAGLLEKVSARQELTAAGQAAWKKVQERVDALCKAAHEHKLPIMIDAEETWIQPAIDQLALDMMQRYNKEDIIVINTYQMYRKDRLSFLQQNYDMATREGFQIGAKLVRGAYMEKERKRAEEKGYPSPIQDTKEDTDRDYNEAVRFCMDRLDHVFLVVATHNEYSSQIAAERFMEMPYPRDYRHMWFSQLLGMCDHISNTLAAEDLNVAKYVPYGPVAAVTPYLIRRADENSSVAGQAKKEMALLKKEIRRRKTNR